MKGGASTASALIRPLATATILDETNPEGASRATEGTPWEALPESPSYDHEVTRLKVEAVLESYRQRRSEILSNQVLYSTYVQIFLSGIFLLLGYSILTGTSELVLLLPLLVLTLFHLVAHLFDTNTTQGAAAHDDEEKINNLLSSNELLNYERKWGMLREPDGVEGSRKQVLGHRFLNTTAFAVGPILGLCAVISALVAFRAFGAIDGLALGLGYGVVSAFETHYVASAATRRKALLGRIVP